MMNTNHCAMPVLALEVNRQGQLSQKTMDLSSAGQLENTLLQSLYPDIRVATVDVPREPLDECEQAIVEQALTRIQVDGIRYSLIGASGAAKKGTFYLVDQKHERKVAERFRNSPEFAVTYFGILVSSCRVMLRELDCRVVVVKDGQLGTNDCRGWISESLFRKLQQKHKTELLAKETSTLLADRMRKLSANERNVPLSKDQEQRIAQQVERNIEAKVLSANRFYQFRLSFDKAQAKGSFKVMSDEVAQKLDAQVILPKSSVKPKYQGSVLRSVLSVFGDDAHAFRGPVTLGIRDVSRDLHFKSSYTLVEHAPKDSIEMEIKPYAERQIEKLRKAWEENDYSEFLELIGSRDTQESLEDGEEPDTEYTSSEFTVAQAALLADGTGRMLTHPFVNNHLQKILAKWAFKLCTAGGFRLPGFALADDGYLFLHNGEVICGSDWIPRNCAFAAIASKRGLVVRYPIRMKEDLLPVNNLSVEEVNQLLKDDLIKSGCEVSEEDAATIVDQQLNLKGTLTLHSVTAARNGGDFDFDLVCMVEGDEFPRFVDHRFAYQEQHTKQKDKTPKKPSPWWNLPQVSMRARGNQIGSITDLKTSCLADGRGDFAMDLVDELQAALDQLKFGTEPNQEAIKKIRDSVTKAPWLALKKVTRISEMALHVDVKATDAVGNLYNHVRKQLGTFLDATAVSPLSDFRGMIGGARITAEIYEECRKVNKTYGEAVSASMERRQQLTQTLRRAESEVEALKGNKDDKEARKKAMFNRNQASTALQLNEQRSQEEMGKMIRWIRLWGRSKEENRLAYLSALHSIVCREKRGEKFQPGKTPSSGSIVFYAFPQEVVDAIAERTGGRPISVDMSGLCDGDVQIDREGRIYFVKPYTTQAGSSVHYLNFARQVTGKGEVFTQRDAKGSPIITRRIRPFAIEAGISEVRNGKLVFPGTQQRPQVPQGKLEPLQPNESDNA